VHSLEGQLLGAAPQLLDPNFARSLELLIQHNHEGAFGVIINRPIGKNIQDLWREVGSQPCRSRRPVHLGGPVPGPLMALHANPELSEKEVVPGVFFAAQKQHLDQLVLNDESDYKVFVGHAGWGAAQLENEMSQGAWKLFPATAAEVFSTDDALWERIFREIGRSILKSILHVDELPPDPTVN